MHGMELYSVRRAVADKPTEDYAKESLRLPRVCVTVKKGAALLARLGYFAGLFIIIGTAGGLEQGTMTDKQVVGWAAAGIGMMAAVAVAGWKEERREEKWQE